MVTAPFIFRLFSRDYCYLLPEGSRVEVLRIDHSASADESHPPISLAVEVNGEWQVFYRIDAIGRMKSPVWPILENLGSRINLTRIVGVDGNDLLRLCDRAFRYVASQLKAQEDVNSDLRGAIPEILAGLLLANKGYRPVKVSLRLKLNSKEIEIDAIGFREADGARRMPVSRSEEKLDYSDPIDFRVGEVHKEHRASPGKY